MTRIQRSEYSSIKRDWRSLRRDLKHAEKHHAPTALIHVRLRACVRAMLDLESGAMVIVSAVPVKVAA